MTRPVCDAIVLAGGRGSRMADPEHPAASEGVDKPALTVGGRRMVDIAVDAVSSCRRTVLVGPLRTGVPEHVVQTRESPAGGGPVAALAAGLKSLDSADSEGTADLVVVLASDLPFLDAAAVESLIGSISHSRTDAVFARDDHGRTQFLLGIWQLSALRSAVAQLDSVDGAPMRRIVPAEHTVIPMSGIEDCDTRSDLLAARRAAQLPETLEVGDALERIRRRLAPLPVHRVMVRDSVGTVLAEPLVSRTALPAVDISAMDGYAVCGTEPWTLRSDIAYAGSSNIAELTDGTAVRIATGAALPPGATSVVRDEHVIREPDGSARRMPTAPQSDDTRRRGEDWLPGTELAAAGTPIDAAVRSLAASAEVFEMAVRGPARGRVVISGNEIRSIGPLAPGETRDVLGSVLPEYLAHCGITVVDVTLLDDTATGFRDVLTRTEDVDVIIVVGATGGGAADQLRTTLVGLDAETVVGRMRMRPGGSQITAALPDGTVVLGLPGNPLAAVGTAMLTAPAIVDALTGRTVRPSRIGLLTNAAEVRSSTPRIVPVTADGTRWRADTQVRTAHLAHLVGRDALAVIPAEVSADEPVTILPLPHH
ncbi:molybdenum cofactor biosynthesis protein [Rhodococcus sp. 05-2255-3B1]|uniref:NTP transferase domain-containing protein n=1 Tax=unclassified Rhodococcus (in: high G+C Gram-positive bacteria) TaxID=192944 RepID=UPI000B9AA592|nr:MULTISPECIES: NTP transferase domain-containing protein [unclassified Rhodococcus (in: high G+C Gram-positive bacteria)]OZE06211.1 molybdenum cofactor biosynthesis protein [Rhodococcus sp. 05-2255-3B1]OZE07380.1 molybdenum cofactor biosynthesis protein [Rhodococcus sp. 05-2255-3C]OZE18363.1 molybdenum cofactor biosynthesis protein [Rhodococcus sp. 05-2255-2A2]